LVVVVLQFALERKVNHLDTMAPQKQTLQGQEAKCKETKLTTGKFT